MREFYLNLLNNLDKLAGLKQLDKIYASHGENREAAKTEIRNLLEILCRVSSMFPYIPEDEQMKIINLAVLTEEFPTLNGNTVYKWLARHKDKFFKEIHHQETQPQAEPLTGEARAAKLDEWLKSLSSFDQMSGGPKMSPDEWKQEGKEWVSEVERKAVSTIPDPDRKKYDEQKLIERNERIRAMQEKSFRDKNPGASEEEISLFMASIKKYDVKVSLPTGKKSI